ncbi:hypothetical protein [Pontibacter sp. HSC-36F09]|uniref:hypothetical protein n=1 Tax=Pontibacter sp. HSC-36F09 TaxID=2910966 RepID=UPI00209E0E53|nr:hypothetical protein [Pontibacter sp. HSC-36F09]MCP2043410.1 hypothetical protein [Pontibacter sp. HSC-36F09]
MHRLRLLLLVVLSVATMASCTTSRKKNSNTGQVVIIKDSKKDSKAGYHKGYKKGWTKNTNNPHHPRTTNPGHTKHKQGKGGNTVIIVNKNNANVKQAAPKGKPGHGNHHNGGKGKGNQGKGNNGKHGNGKGGKK